MIAVEYVVPNACDVLKSGAFFRQNLQNSSHSLSGSQARNKEAQETLRVVFARERLGSCRMTCSSCEPVQQQAVCSEQMFSIYQNHAKTPTRPFNDVDMMVLETFLHYSGGTLSIYVLLFRPCFVFFSDSSIFFHEFGCNTHFFVILDKVL